MVPFLSTGTYRFFRALAVGVPVFIKVIFQRSWAIALAVTAFGLVSAMPAAAAVAYLVTVDTSSVNGSSGFLDFQFNPGNASSQAATAQIANFTTTGGSVSGVPTTTGNVSGTLPGTVTLQNSTALNEYFQGFNYGIKYSFVLILSGPALDSPNGTATAGTRFCLGLYDAGQSPILTNQPSGCAGTVDINLDGTTTATAYPSSVNGAPSVVTFSPTGLPGSLQIRYMSNLNAGDSVIDLSNSGATTVAGATSDICANVYTFMPDEQEISCCSCLVTPNALNSLSVQSDLVQTSLTSAVPTSVVVKLIATAPVGGTCNPAAPGVAVTGLFAWGTTIHAAPTTPVSYQATETQFLAATLSAAELNRDVTECQFIQTLGSGNFGICKSCRNGGLGAVMR